MEPSRSNDGPSGAPAKNLAAPRRRGMWSQARQLAERTPETRNRYVDFLRGISICSVVFGHWLMAAPYYAGGQAHMAHLLAVVPWSQWLTWIFQVMPIFFFVGGYANMTSWQAAQRRGQGYNHWLGSRLQRLLGPVLPLLCTWMVIAWAGHILGIPSGFIQVGSRIALVPTWFLAVYIVVVLFVPFTYAAWKRLGLWTIAIPIVCASAVDLLFFSAGWHLVGWLNYLFVWLTVHQLGYAWRDRRLPSSGWLFVGCIIGWCTLLALVCLGPYPLSLVGVPTDQISNTLPPKLPLLALGFAQIGLVMSLERPARRWLEGMIPWAGTVMINGMIMTVFLWHSTAMMLVIGLGFFVWPGVFAVAPGSVTWWLVRPVWVALFAGATVPFLLGFSRFERTGAARQGKPLPVWRLYVGCVSACASLGYLSLRGVGSGSHWSWDVVALVLPFVGAACAGFGPLSRIPAGCRSR
jgi:fucose 4-O-acetylase-like acetyltransferase